MTAVDLASEADNEAVGDRGDGGAGGATAEVVTSGGSGASEAARRRRWKLGPLLPARLRPLDRPILWLEAAILAIGYELYTQVRLAAPAHERIAKQRGYSILNFEHDLGINFELTVNHAVDKISPL